MLWSRDLVSCSNMHCQYLGGVTGKCIYLWGIKMFMDSGRKHGKLRKGKKERKLREGQKLLDCRSFNNPPPKSSTPSDMVLL